MDNKYIIWFLGANASGKSTLSALIQRELSDKYPRYHRDARTDFIIDQSNGVILTLTSSCSANLGKFNHPVLYDGKVKTNACCGTDTLPKKTLIARALEVAGSNEIKFIFVEGIMATRQWVDIFPEGYRILLVLLDIDIENCILRLTQRRSEKSGLEQSEVLESLTEKTVDNVSGKINGFRRMYEDLILRRDIVGMKYAVDQSFNSVEISKQIANLLVHGKI